MEKQEQVSIDAIYNAQLALFAELRKSMRQFKLVVVIAIMSAAMSIANTLFIINVILKGF